MATLQQTVFESSTPTAASPLPISTSTTAFQRLALAVQHRSTSKPEDEPVILAITFGLPLRTILDASDHDARLGALLVLLRDVPADVVFAGAWPGERCARAGFRWAPRSLLGFPRIEPRATAFGPGAVCDELGLHACYQGLLLDTSAGGGGRVLTGERWYAVDEMSGMKYEFRPHGEGGAVVPERCALLFRAYGIGGDTAVASIVREGQEVGQDEVEVIVVGHCVMVASGGLECADGVPILQGRLTTGDQRWHVT
ncbi:hypothetical protein CERSUDRAFT_92251 [Gelatoporia subvermispora B]|uniref:Uncharacterized protein n=1 Tax=Ceriporiopsis subvermispora (strain B) TaxID=914234 RepID=M2PSV5_CERS8|nr:hypothetical protein CERSUDRAFT_92251 [Gelatoporia subvermispora B]